MRCLRCNRILRTVASYERGYGRKCWQTVLEELRGEQLELDLAKDEAYYKELIEAYKDGDGLEWPIKA